MNILVLGNKGYGERSHCSENIALEFSQLGHVVTFIGVEDIQGFITEKRYNLHKYNKLPFRISRFEAEKDKIDLIFADQCDFEWLNDVKIPVFYNQKYVHRRFGCFYPTVAFFLTSALMEYSKTIFCPYEFYLSKYKYILPSATETDTYKPKEKIYKGVSWFGSRNDNEAKVDHIELLGIAQRTLEVIEQKKLRKIASKVGSIINMFETPVSTLEYREILPKCEAHYFSIPRGQFITRMMFESMACKTLCVFEVQSDRHEQILREMGLTNGEHYIGFKGFFNLKNIEKIYEETPNKEQIIEDAYNLVLSKHLHKHRAERILEIYDNYFKKEKN